MILDIVLLVIMVLSAVFAFRKGFVFTLISTVGWIAAMAGAYLATPYAIDFVDNNTGFHTWLYDLIKSRFDVSLDTLNATVDSLPGGISPEFSTDSTNIVVNVAEGLTTLFEMVLVFLILFLLIKLLLWFVLHWLSKQYSDGFINVADGLFGLLFGLLRGLILIMLLLAAMLPLCNLASPDVATWMTNQLDASFVAGQLYDNNVLLVLIQNSVQ